LDVQALFKQAESWIHSADPEGRVFEISEAGAVLDDEKHYGSFGIFGVCIRLLTGEGGTVTLEHRALVTTRKNTFGLLEMSGALKKYYVYRRMPQPGTETAWDIVNSDNNHSEPWSQASFEKALQELLK